MANVLLPCDYEEWWEDKRLFMLLSHMRSVKDLQVLISSHTRENTQPTVLSKRLKNLSGLVTFLQTFCTAEEQKVYAGVTLPFIARSACCLDERVPESGIPFIVQQESAALVLGRKLVMSLLANAFLCTFPESQFKHIQPFNFNRFFDVFKQKDMGRRQTQAAKLKCILCYFQRAAENKCDLSGVLTIRRQVVLKNDLPTLADWASSQYPLCRLEVNEDIPIEKSGSHTLQVNFANRKIGGGVLAGGRVQEEIRFSIFPELIVSRLIMDHMDANEAIIITGAEQFSTYKGYGSALEFGGEWEDKSERDVFGNFLTSTVAIDARSVGQNPEKQYDPKFILRELNKAFVGFLCQQDRGDIATELLALNVNRPSITFIAEHYPDHFHSPNAPGAIQSSLGNLNASSQPVQRCLPSKSTPSMPDTGPPLSPIKEDSEFFQYTSIADGILKSGIESATKNDDDAQPTSQGAEMGNDEAVSADQYASDLASSLFGGIQSKEKPVKRLEASQDGGGVDNFVSTLTADIFKSTSQPQPEGQSATPSEKPPPPISKEVDDLASSLSSAIINSSSESGSSDSSKPQPGVDEAAAGKLAKSIVSDVFSSWKAPSIPGSLPAQTSDQPASIPSTQTVNSFSDQLASNIMSGAFSLVQTVSVSPSPGHPAIFIQVERRGSSGSVNESPRSSRSSSLTGQTITLHEFTDDLAENVIKDGLTIAQFTNQGQNMLDRENERQEVNQFAERLVSLSITEAVGEHSKSTQPQKAPPDDQPMSLPEPNVPTGAKKPLKHTLLFSRQELAFAAARLTKRGSVDERSETSDTDTPFQLNPRLLTPSSSRMSMGYAWSTASTRDEDSRPVSPTDLDRIALGLTTDIEDYSYLFTKILISDAILNVCGERPNRSRQSRGNDQSHGVSGNLSSLPSEMKIDSFLSGLDQAEALSQGSTEETDALTSFVPNWQQKMKTMLLRPVSTGNWGCGAFKGDPQLKSMLQWVVASYCGRPQLIYSPFKNEAVKNLGQVSQHLRSEKWTAGQLCQVLLDFCKRPMEERAEKDLYSTLLSM